MLPARAHLRYNLDERSYLLGGYEAEGNQYYLGDAPGSFAYGHNFLRRGEIRPRVLYERSLYRLFWLSVQAGMRFNGRFAIADDYNAAGNDNLVKFHLSPAPYAQVGLALVAP